jgi:hypothetical protein
MTLSPLPLIQASDRRRQVVRDLPRQNHQSLFPRFATFKNHATSWLRAGISRAASILQRAGAGVSPCFHEIVRRFCGDVFPRGMD